MTSIQAKDVLHTKGLTIGYGSTRLTEDLNMRLGSGELLGLIGRNGTGKSTLLRTLAGLMEPLSGEVWIAGKHMKDMTTEQRAKEVSIVLTERVNLHGLTARDVVQLGRHPFAGRFSFVQEEDYAIADQVMQQLAISGLADKSMAQLSDGEQQKVMIARAMAQQTPLILLDEPTAFLDYVAKEEIFELLSSIASTCRLSIVFSSHDIALVEKYAHRTLKLGQ